MKKRYFHHLIALLAVLATSLSAMAQDVLVNVTPKNPILPPQLLLYVNDPSQFFTVQLTNTTSEEQRVYLSLGIEHIFPNDGLYACTPDNYQPARPFVVPANGVYSLTLTDMKALYNHIPASAMKIPDGLIDGYTNGSFGLLPEGTYSVQFSAWRWTGNNKDVPYCVSGANSGKAEFRVCYMASAPEWMLPMPIIGPEQFDVCEVDRNTPVFGWTAPIQGCDRLVNYSYVLKFVEVLPFQTPDVAMDVNPTILQTEPITSGQTNYTIPVNRRDLFKEDKTYAVQVIASQKSTSKFDYVMMTNDGKSPLRLFRMSEQEDFEFFWGEDELIDSLYSDTKYTFRNPTLLEPTFQEGNVRKVYIENAIRPSWEAPWYLGGYGDDPEDLDFSYKVELYNGKGVTDWEQVINEENLIYSLTTSEQSDSIPWEKIKDKVSIGDFLLLRIDPLCTNDEEVIFNSDSVRIKDFTLTNHISPDYFSCTDKVEIDNKQPTTKSASDYKGKEIGIGQYQLVIDEIEGTGEKGFTGKGRVRWDVGIGTLMVHVKFKDMKINTDDIVYEGDCEAYENPSKPTNLDAVNSIFSDLGLEDLMANTSIPYAEQITEGAKKLASEKIDGIADYYSLVKGGKAIWDMLVNGAETDVYLPLCLPKENKGLKSLNSSPVDIQITQMKFSPASATMNLIGEFTMPDSKCLASDMLVFGAPRLCISPDNILPEAGTLALLDNFTVKDPSSGYDCKFKAPKNLLEPTDGCYLAWKDFKFEILGIDMDMSIPKLKKVDEKTGEAKDEFPNLHIQASIASWDDFLVDDITMDPFEVASIPGFTFKADKLTFDHSLLRNSANMASLKLPKEYKNEEAIESEKLAMYGFNAWEGFYMHQLKVQFPKGLTGFDEERLTIDIEDMLIDPSGLTMDAGIEKLFNASAGGYAVAIDKIGLKIIQNNFDNCYFDGSLTVPLIKTDKDENAKLGFNCQIRKQLDDKGNKLDDYAYIFNTKSLNGDYKLDMFIAKLQLEQKLTYLLLEAEPLLEDGPRGKKGDMDTRVELLLGGKIEIGGKAAAEGWIKKTFGFDFSLPDIHFVGMRLANCASWKSKYVDFQVDLDKERATQKSNALAGLYYGGKAFHNGEKDDASDCTFYFHTGSWSLASMSKKLGPFEFTLEDYNFDDTKFEGEKLNVGLTLSGKVAIVKGIDISASATLTLKGSVNGVSTDIANFDFSKIDCDFDKPELKSLGVDASFCGVVLKGKVDFENDKYSSTGKGFMAAIDVTLPGDLFSVHGDGGLFDYKDEKDSSNDYSWGWLHLSVGGKIQLGPCAITKLGGGFYMNSRRNPKGDDQKAINEKGLVGILLELGMATPDGETLQGDLSLNVVYNRPRKCLSNFTMTGNVKAAGGIINSNMTLVYENTPDDKYLQLNITVDAGLDDEALVSSLGDFAGSLGTIKEQMQKMAGDKFTEILTDCKQGLSSKIGAHAEEPPAKLEDAKPSPTSAEENPQSVAQNNKTDKKGGLSMMKATISLDVKITWKAGGTVYSKPKWHVYLGEPDEDKRCTFTYIDFGKEGDIVSCHIGANGYVCVGNELPNNGELPPIPEKISKFLDGSQKGDFKSDNASTANASRSQAMAQFNGDVSGGVMLGAQGVGRVSVNLGLLYGKIETILGFDASLVHYKNGYCVNLNKIPGYRQWYAKGQLYAYLYMDMGVRFDLGFIDYDLPLAEAEVGGVLKMGGPKPTYFEGKARARVSLLGGLFKFDKSFSFDCGETCQMFKGNPLDDFVLYDDCTLGDTIRSKGWYVESANKKAMTSDIQAKVKTNIRIPQYINTKAPLDEHFRMLDENELERIASQFGEGSEKWEQSKMQACRTMIFKDKRQLYLYEYDSPSQYKAEGTTVAEDASFDFKYTAAVYDLHGSTKSPQPIKLVNTGSNSRHYIDMADFRSKIKPGKFYRLRAVGYSKEIEKGVEVDPYTYYNDAKNVGNIAWVSYVDYYFQTEAAEEISDKANLQEYVAIAYPSDKNLLKTNESHRDQVSGLMKHSPAYLNDVQAPTIALTQDIRDKAFKKGKLYWRLLNPMGGQLDIAENKWVEYTSKGVKTLNMEPERKLNAVGGQDYIISLDYYTGSNLDTIYVAPKGSDLTEEQMRAATKSDPYIGKYNPYWQISAKPDTTLVYLHVSARREQYNWQNSTPTDYAKPFMAEKLIAYSINKPYSGSVTDKEIHEKGYAMQSPMTFVGYMSNFAFPAGWEITEKNYYNIQVTTSESLIFQSLQGGGKYEGIYNPDKKSSTDNAYDDILNKMIYRVSDLVSVSTNRYEDPVQYPLSGDLGKLDYDYVYDVNDRISPFQYSSTGNYITMTKPLFNPILDIYDRTSKFNYEITNTAVALDEVQAEISSNGDDHDQHNSLSAKENKVKEWHENRRGTYLTEDGNFVPGINSKNMYFVPTYQFPCIWSITGAEGIQKAYKGLSNSCDRHSVSSPLWGYFTGREYLIGKYTYIWQDARKEQAYDIGKALPMRLFEKDKAKSLFKSAVASVYRVNSFDMESGHYWVNPKLLNGKAEIQIRITDPLTDDKKAELLKTLGNDDLERSVGSSTGVSVAKVDTTKQSYGSSYSTLSDACARVKELHDSIQTVYKYAEENWNKYPAAASAIQKNTDYTVKYVDQAIKYFLMNTSDGRTRSDLAKENALKYYKNTTDNINEVYYCYSYTRPDKEQYVRVKVDNGITSVRHRAVNDMLSELNALMDQKVSSSVDIRSTQYSKYKSMQDESNSCATKMKFWNDSLYNSRYWVVTPSGEKIMGHANQCSWKALYAKKLLDNLTDPNYEKYIALRQRFANYYLNALSTSRSTVYNVREVNTTCNSIATWLESAKSNDISAYFKIKLKTLEDARAFVANINSIPDRLNDIASMASTIKDKADELTGQIVESVGANGKSGIYGQLKDLFSERLALCVEILEKVVTMNNTRDELLGHVGDIEKKISTLSDEQTRQKVLAAATRRLWELEGKDVEAADRLLDEFEQIENKAKQKLMPYENEETRLKFKYLSDDQFEKISKEYSAYRAGDVVIARERCIEYYNDYVAMQLDTKMNQYMDQADATIVEVNTMADDIFRGLAAAGFAETDQCYQDVKARWAEIDNQDTFNAWKRDFRNANASILQRLATAETYKEQARSYFASDNDDIGRIKFIRTKIVQLSSDVERLVGSDENRLSFAHLWVGSAYNEAQKMWDEYEESLLEMYSNFNVSLQQCLSSCTKAEEYHQMVVDIMNDTEVYHEVEEICDVAAEYMRHMPYSHFVPTWNDYCVQTREKYQQLLEKKDKAATRKERAEAYLKSSQMTAVYDNGIVPLQKKAQEALDYLETHYEPYRPVESLIKGNMKRVETNAQYANDAYTNGSSELTVANKTQTSIVSLNKSLKLVQDGWTDFLATKPTTERLNTALESYISYCMEIQDKITVLERSIKAVSNAYDLVQSYYSSAMESFDYIDQHKMEFPADHQHAKTIISGIQTKGLNLANAIPTLRTQLSTAKSKLTDMLNFKEQMSADVKAYLANSRLSTVTSSGSSGTSTTTTKLPTTTRTTTTRTTTIR